MLLLALTTWPLPTQDGARGDVTAAWASISRAIGVALAAAPSVTRWSVAAAKIVLALGAVALVAVGALSAGGAGAVGMALAAWVPAILALVAAALIGPRQRPEVVRAEQARKTRERDAYEERRAA